MERDFKGVWIPREIWLNEELSALDKIIFTEISSLDNENHCTASNEYLAKFCQCSERKVTDAIKKLKDMGLISEATFDGRRRILSIAKNATQGSKNCESESQKLLSINIDNKQTNKNTSTSKDVEVKPKKKNLYEKCIDAINSFTESEEVRDILTVYLKFRLEIKDKPIYVNQWIGMLNKLRELTESKAECIEIIQQSIDRGYLSFFPISKAKRNTSCETNVVCATMSEEEKQKQNDFVADMKKRGERIEF